MRSRLVPALAIAALLAGCAARERPYESYPLIGYVCAAKRELPQGSLGIRAYLDAKGQRQSMAADWSGSAGALGILILSSRADGAFTGEEWINFTMPRTRGEHRAIRFRFRRADDPAGKDAIEKPAQWGQVTVPVYEGALTVGQVEALGRGRRVAVATVDSRGRVLARAEFDPALISTARAMAAEALSDLEAAAADYAARCPAMHNAPSPVIT